MPRFADGRVCCIKGRDALRRPCWVSWRSWWPWQPVGGRGAARAAPAEPGPPTFSVAGGRLRLEVCADDIVRVAFAKDDAFFTRPSLMAAPKRCTSPAWKLTRTDETATSRPRSCGRTSTATGAVAFLDAAGRPIAASGPGTDADARDRHGRATTSRAPAVAAERRRALYGLGQHQQGLVDIKGTDLELRQYNSEIFIPLLVSSRGYGILWDNTSFTRFGDRHAEPLPGTGDSRERRTAPADWTDRTRRSRATISSGPIRPATVEVDAPATGGHRSLAAGLAAE